MEDGKQRRRCESRQRLISRVLRTGCGLRIRIGDRRLGYAERYVQCTEEESIELNKMSIRMLLNMDHCCCRISVKV